MSTTEQKNIKKNTGWGLGVWLIYGAFVIFMIGCVIVASFQDFELVRPDYYAHQLTYQETIEKIRRLETLSEKPTVRFERDMKHIQISFPDNMNDKTIVGSIVLFRASNASLDQSFELMLNKNLKHNIPTASMALGLWRVSVDFTVDSVDYFLEQPLELF